MTEPGSTGKSSDPGKTSENAQPAVERQPPVKKYSRNAKWGILLAYLVLISYWTVEALLAGPREPAYLGMIGIAALVVALPLHVWGCYFLAKSKGYHGAVGIFWGFIPLWGLCVLLNRPIWTSPVPDVLPSEEEQATLRRHAIMARRAITLGLPAQPLGLGLFLVGYLPVMEMDSISFLGAVISLGGLGLCAWGCSSWAKRKGHHWALGVPFGAAPLGLGLLFFGFLPDKTKTEAHTKPRVFSSVLGVMLLLIIIGIVFVIWLPMYVSHERATCDRMAAADVRNLAVALERFRSECKERKCPSNMIAPEQVQYLIGPHYGWNGTNKRCRVLIRVSEEEACACSPLGRRPTPRDPGARYLYRIRLSDGSELPVTYGQCRGKSYGGPGEICYTESLINENGRFRAPNGVKCETRKRSP